MESLLLFNDHGNSPYYEEVMRKIEHYGIAINSLVIRSNVFYKSTFDCPDVPHYDPVYCLKLLVDLQAEGDSIPWDAVNEQSEYTLLAIASDLDNGIPYARIAPFFLTENGNYDAFRKEQGFIIEDTTHKEGNPGGDGDSREEDAPGGDGDSREEDAPTYFSMEDSEFTPEELAAKKVLDSKAVTLQFLQEHFRFPVDKQCIHECYTWFMLQLYYLKQTITSVDVASYYLDFIIWFMFQCSREQIHLLCSKFIDGLISPLVFIFYDFYNTKSDYVSPLFNYDELYYVKNPIDSFSLNTNKAEWIYGSADSVFLDREAISEIMVQRVNFPLVILVEYEEQSLKLTYQYDFGESNYSRGRHPYHVDGKPFMLRGWDFRRDSNSYYLPLSMNSIYTLLTFTDCLREDQLLQILNSDKHAIKNALFNAACAYSLGDRTYSSLLQRDDLGLPVFQLLSFYILGEDSLFGALLRYLADLLGLYEQFSTEAYPMNVDSCVILKDNKEIELLDLLVAKDRVLQVIHEADYYCPVLVRRNNTMYLVEEGGF